MYQKENNNKTFENKKLSELGIYIYIYGVYFSLVKMLSRPDETSMDVFIESLHDWE